MRVPCAAILLLLAPLLTSTAALPLQSSVEDLLMARQCPILNYEKEVQDFPAEMVINGAHFKIFGQIQHGATSRVFHAMEKKPSHRCMAVKVVDMERIEHQKQNQVTNEVALLHELSQKNVERIPALYELEHNPSKSISMVMELAHHDLFDEITPKMGRGEREWVRRTLRDILRAIQPVHDNGIVHGDLKPENMAYFRTGPEPDSDLVLKVIDFGGAMHQDAVANACKEVVTGTIMYMSPEQVAWCAAHGDPEFHRRRSEFQLSKKSDVWSLGIILYQMLFGRSPYSDLMHQFDHLSEPERTEKVDDAMRPHILNAEEPVRFAQHEDGPVLDLLKQMLERRPEHRPHVNELLEQLEQFEQLEAGDQGETELGGEGQGSQENRNLLQLLQYA